MTRNHAPLGGPLAVSLVAIAFCVWTALGNDVNLCVTTGCTLYADFTIAGISMWWFGVAAFTIIAACALLGQTRMGRVIAGLALLGDICLLLLMAVTAPCVNCLVVALLFAICYLLFRRKAIAAQRQNPPAITFPSVLLWVWLALFVVNLGQVARSQIDTWPILNESGEPVTRMFFSPGCPYCVESINALSGKVDVAFYPVAENDGDVAKIEKMATLLTDGENIRDALAGSSEAVFPSFWEAWKPSVLLLRFRLLCNKAHLFSQGSQGVPFFEHKGLMPGLLAKSRAGLHRQEKPLETEEIVKDSAPVSTGGDAALPLELQEGLQCGGRVPCPPAGLGGN